LTSSRQDSSAAPHEVAEPGADNATGHDAEPSAQRSRFAKFHNLQQRLEDSRNGRRVITGLIAVILGVQILWNLPDSTIRQTVTPVVDPATLIGVTERWPMFSPDPTQRIEYLDVTVTMADGSTRTWTVNPYPPFKRVFVANRWLNIKESAIRRPEVRPELARWVVDEVTEPGEQAAKVVMTMRFERLLPPGQHGPTSPAVRILYQEEFAKQP
jgi:hypothetical protein